MGKINGCMKAVFIVFNGLFAVEAWLAALAAFLISLLGNLAARIESKFLLKVFAVLMGIGMEVMLICGVVVIGWIIQTKSCEDRSVCEVQLHCTLLRCCEKTSWTCSQTLHFYLWITSGLYFIAMMGLIFSVIMVKQIRPTGSDRIRQRHHTVGAAVEMTTD